MRLKRRERFFLFANQFNAGANLIVLCLYSILSFGYSISLFMDIATLGDAVTQFFFTTPFMLLVTFLCYKLFQVCNDFQRYYHNYRKLVTILKLNPTKDYEISELEDILSKK